jgi:hypothetical protein
VSGAMNSGASKVHPFIQFTRRLASSHGILPAWEMQERAENDCDVLCSYCGPSYTLSNRATSDESFVRLDQVSPCTSTRAWQRPKDKFPFERWVEISTCRGHGVGWKPVLSDVVLVSCRLLMVLEVSLMYP